MDTSTSLKYSIICCYNNQTIVEEYLIKSLSKQRHFHELILVDNRENVFSSAAKALNYGAQKAKGSYLLFIHQDVSFEENFLDQLDQYVDNSYSIYGIAGVKDSTGVYANFKQGLNQLNAGDYSIKDPIEVQTLDEVFILLSRELFKALPFDENTCKDWHLYGVDLCLSAKEKGVLSIALPLDVIHLSSGRITLGYVKTLYKVILKHRKNFPYIYTTCTQTKTSFYRMHQYILGLWWDHVVKPMLGHK